MQTQTQNKKYAMLNNAHKLYKEAKKCSGLEVQDFEESVNLFHLSPNPEKDYEAKMRISSIARRNALAKIVSTISPIPNEKTSELRDYALQTLLISGGFE